MTTDSEKVWSDGLPNELQHWKWWLTEGPEVFKNEAFNDYEWRTDPGSDLRSQPHLTRYLEAVAPAGAKVSILDVGAGPLTCVGKVWPERTVEITPVDPLAAEYNRLLDEIGLTPLVRTQYAVVEKLAEVLPLNHFDLVYCQNALDHVYDPVQGIHQMLEVVKPGHAVVLMHNENEGEREHYHGLHQWNFGREQDQFVIWNGAGRVNVNDDVAGVAEVRFEESHSPSLLITSLIKKG